MKAPAVAMVVCVLTLSGCATWHRVPNSPEIRQSNSIEYDAYVRRREAQLAAGGTSSNDASMAANAEAARRFGERIEGGTTQAARWTWTQNTSKGVTLSELDQTVSSMKKK